MKNDYIEGNYYEFFGYSKRHIVRLIKIDNFKYTFKDLTLNEEKTLSSVNFSKLQLTVCRNPNLTDEVINNNEIKISQFQSFINNVISKYYSRLELHYNIEKMEYFFKGSTFNENLPKKIEDDINDFFKGLQEIINKEINFSEKDDFIINLLNN
jgi:hypothetical protein